MKTDLNNKYPYVVAITGASGAIYAFRLLEVLNELKATVHLIVTSTAEHILKAELTSERVNFILETGKFERHDANSYAQNVASGSYQTSGMIVIPASMGTVGRIANGTSDNLVIRAADVHLKERRNLIIVPRETPFNRIHLENLLKLNDAGALILPAIPSFYSSPSTIEDVADTVVARIIDHLGLDHDLVDRYHGAN